MAELTRHPIPLPDIPNGIQGRFAIRVRRKDSKLNHGNNIIRFYEVTIYRIGREKKTGPDSEENRRRNEDDEDDEGIRMRNYIYTK